MDKDLKTKIEYMPNYIARQSVREPQRINYTVKCIAAFAAEWRFAMSKLLKYDIPAQTKRIHAHEEVL